MKKVYEFETRVWQQDGSTAIRSESTDSRYPMMHTLLEEEWELIKGIFDALVDPSPPITTIVGLIEDYNEHME